MRKIIVFGPQGCGKGTQAKMLMDKLLIPHISTGDIFRYNIKNKTELGKEALKYIDNGNLVPDDVTNLIVKDRLSKDDCANGFILDGYPRNISQAEYLSTIVEIDNVIEIHITDEEAVKRISGRRICEKCGTIFHLEYNPPANEKVCDKCGGNLLQRDDDMPDAIKNRLNIYHTETEPVLDFYRAKGKLIKINGEQSIEKVFEDILRELKC